METTSSDTGVPSAQFLFGTPTKHAYLVVHIEPSTMTVKGVATYSEQPWNMTRMLGRGRDIIAIIMDTVAESYSEALDHIYEAYPVYEPELAERFPLPPRTSGEGEVLIAGTVESSGLVWRSLCGHVEPMTEDYDDGDSEPCVHCEDEDCIATVEREVPRP